ncbi:MAG: DUF1513 domain-containing protein [Hyphomicrobiales bacterium]
MHVLATGDAVERRTFLKSAGAVFVASLTPSASFALDKSDAVLASAYREADGEFGVALVSERGDILFQHKLPARGHDVVWHPDGATFVVFARRPGTFAVIINQKNERSPATITSPLDRHFYGHGCFSSNGKLLYATENDFENAKGKIGIYDTTNGFKRIGEFDAYGVGPHDIELTAGGNFLLVANGGIETHPDFARTKLNLPTMKPNLSIIDLSDGSLHAQFNLPEQLHKLSIRHLASSTKDTTWFACQNEGDLLDAKQLVGRLSLASGTLEWLELPDSILAGLRGYVGSIAFCNDTGHIAITSPRGGIAHVIDPATRNIVETIRKPDVCGATALEREFEFSSGEGFLAGRQYKVRWDNHLSVSNV